MEFILLKITKIFRGPQAGVKLVAVGVIVALCVGLAAIEWAGLKPDWMTGQRKSKNTRIEVQPNPSP